MNRIIATIFLGAVFFALSACAASTPTPNPTAAPPTHTAVPTQIIPPAAATATRVPNTAAPTQILPPKATSSKQILDLTWTRDGKQIVTTTGDAIVVYAVNPLQPSATITLPLQISVVRSLPTEHDLAVGAEDTVRFMTMQGEFLTRELRGGSGNPSTIAQSADGRRIAAGFIGNYQGGLSSAALWDTASGRLVNTTPLSGPVTRIAFQNDGNALLIASAVNSCARGGGGVFHWNFSSDPELIFDANGNSVTDLALAPTEKLAATITQRGTARCLGPAQVDLWNIESREILKNFSYPQDVSALAFSPDGIFLVIGTTDGTVHLINVKTQKGMREFQAKPGAFVRLAFSPDGKLLAAATSDEIFVWAVSNP